MNTTLNTTNERLKKTFNIVSHEGPPRKVDTMQVQAQRKSNTRDFNFMTNMRWDDHQQTPLLYDEEYNIEKIKRRNSNRAVTSHAKVRDFNMISNDYYEDPVGRKQREDSQLKESLTKKFWATHSYDPVKAQYYDQLREEQYLQQRDTITSVHGSNATLKLPPSVQYSDGNSYNILNHSVYDDQRLKATTVMEDRSLNRIKRREIETKMAELGEMKGISAEEKMLNRASFKRWEQQVDRGYNILSNSVVLDAPSPHPTRPPSMWTRLNTAHSGVRASTGNMEALADWSRELVPTGRARNLSGSGGGLPSSQDIVEFSSAGNNSSDAPARFGLKTAPVQSTSATQLPSIAINHFDNARSSRRGSRDIPQSNIGEASRGPSRQNVASSSNGQSSRPGIAASERVGSRAGGIPSLDLTRTEFAENVTYQEPLSGGAKGQAVPMVRTGGGLSSYRHN